VKITKAGNFNPPSGFANVGGIMIDKGHSLCVYTGENQTNPHGYYCAKGPRRFFIPDIHPGFAKNTKSYRLIKDCNDPQFIWDKDCNGSIDANKVTNGCTFTTSKCHQNKILYCDKLRGGNDSEKCAEFCNENHGKCDGFMKSYCAKPENKDKQSCRCLNSAVSKYNPMCIDGKCVANGYATTDMLSKECPSIVDCGIYHDVKDTGRKVHFTDTTIEQRCNAKMFTDGVTDTADIVPIETESVPTAPNVNPLQSLEQPKSSRFSWNWSSMIMILMILATIGVSYYYRSKCISWIGFGGCLGTIGGSLVVQLGMLWLTF
jgi:hypothetical protein